MAITNIDEYAHLSSGDIELLGAELTSIRRDVEDSRSWRDARYIRRTIAFQRALDASSRLLLALSRGGIGAGGSGGYSAQPVWVSRSRSRTWRLATTFRTANGTG